ncbi:helix-turn-helix transcriptional regulator [Mucilaginibacter sp. ZT4R22]|uniref:Helix-turn-helix transcriptional regulator n=1 Tax=Mucilaginibacter pankratovii TaxID=2772110 RepID=A0ABR7WUJ1_9SPHI|nr:AraC family transcriptional regulator [Mucilaginibacter pankratovii]MBD1365979.1 helix-turn-helix transcriptional regulator [Mucilaginibacter pankratovii]
MLTITHPPSSESLFRANVFALEGSNHPFIWLTDNSFFGFTANIRVFQVAGISAFATELKFPETTPLMIRLDEPVLTMCYTLAGHFSMTDSSGEGLDLQEQGHFILPAQGNKEVVLAVKGNARLFVVCFYGDVLSKLLSEEETMLLKSKMSVNNWLIGRPVTLPMAEIIGAVLHCADNNCLHQIYLTAKMLELLFISMEQLKQAVSPRRPPLIKANDLEKLELAKQIIKNNLRQPYSVIDLAHKVGLNDFKLKKGFRDAFGTTVFGYLFTLRMEKAMAMLSSGNHKVSEVAHEVGYKNAHHFSVAFKKQFGYLPSKIFIAQASLIYLLTIWAT